MFRVPAHEQAADSTMTDPECERLAVEAQRQRVGTRWLREIRSACVDTSRRFDPGVYAVAEASWTDGEIDELAHDLVVEQLLGRGQLAYILDVAASITDVRRLLRHLVRRVLVARRRLTVVDRLLARLRPILDGPDYESLPASAPTRYRPAGSSLRDMPTDALLHKAAAAIRYLPTSTASGDRAPAVFRSEVLSRAAALSFSAAGTTLSIGDFDRILRAALTSWVPVMLVLDDEFDATPDDSTDPPGDMEDLEAMVETMLEQLDGTDRLVLRCKLSGGSDSELATRLNVSRPAAARRKNEAFDRLRHAWETVGGDLAPEGTERVAQQFYLGLTGASEDL